MKQVRKKKIADVYSMKCEVWLYEGVSAWHFISVPARQSALIKKHHGAHARGWGSLPVSVRIGGSEWKTSIFPDKKSNCYLLPLKALVRKKENIRAGERVSVHITIV